MALKEKLFKLGEDAKNSAEKLAKGAIDSSKKVAEKAKIKNNISKAESRLNAVYIELGKKFEEVCSEQAGEGFAELLAQAAEAKAEITQAKIDLAAVDSAYICEGCGEYVQEGQSFCPNCGAKQPEPPVVEAEEQPEAIEAVDAEVVDSDESAE